MAKALCKAKAHEKLVADEQAHEAKTQVNSNMLDNTKLPWASIPTRLRCGA